MKIKKLVASAMAIGTAVLGLNLATIGPAAAAEGAWTAYGNRNPITSNSSWTWKCGATRDVTSNVLAQVCAIRLSSGTVRGAVIVRNNRSGLYGLEAAVSLSDHLGFIERWTCDWSGVGAKSWSVCYGSWYPSGFAVYALGGVNGVDFPPSPYV